MDDVRITQDESAFLAQLIHSAFLSGAIVSPDERKVAVEIESKLREVLSDELLGNGGGQKPTTTGDNDGHKDR